jgi:hypothetical protein
MLSKKRFPMRSKGTTNAWRRSSRSSKALTRALPRDSSKAACQTFMTFPLSLVAALAMVSALSGMLSEPPPARRPISSPE